jgi:hypothetical protein
LVVAGGWFGAGLPVQRLALIRGVLMALDVLPIICGAYMFYRVTAEAGAIDALSEALPALTPTRGLQALVIGWAFASFLQGVGGFGVPVAVTAPILAGLGFAPLTAVLVPSIGHAWAVTFDRWPGVSGDGSGDGTTGGTAGPPRHWHWGSSAWPADLRCQAAAGWMGTARPAW